MPASARNQYNVPLVQPRPIQTVQADYARLIARRFPGARLLVVGREPAEYSELWRRESAQVTVCVDLAALAAFSQNGSAPPFDLTLWFYPAVSETTDDVGLLVRIAEDLVLLPATSATGPKRRPQLVAELGALGFFPDYESDVAEIESGAIRLRRAAPSDAASLVQAAETGFARLNTQLLSLQRRLRTRLSELEVADRHIAQLEEKVLKLKEARRDLKQLKAEKQALRKSPERKVGQVILAPYRLPQKLLREVRKRWPALGNGSANAAPNEYQKWFETHRVQPAEAEALRQEARKLSLQPMISIITPVHDTPRRWLREAIISVEEQIYENWELLLVDDASTNQDTLDFLAKAEQRDPRLRVFRLPQKSGISAASNVALENARGDWIALLDHDDLLEPDAVFCTVQLLREHPEADLVYTDEDKLTEDGLAAPLFKPDWSPDFFLSYNYVCHFTTIRRSLVQKLGGFRSEYDFAQDYDLFLRVISHTNQIHHIPRILYHWRRSAGSTATNIRSKPDALEAARRGLTDHLVRQNEPGHVAIDWRTHGFRIRRHLLRARKIAILIPTRDRTDLLRRCVESVVAKTAYENYEIIIIDNDSDTEEARVYFENLPHRILRYSGPFNYSAMNNFAVEQTDAPWILFLNNDTEAIESDWLTAMAEHVQRPEVGAVGARLVRRDGTIQHAGVVLGLRGMVKHAFYGFPAEDPGVCRQLQVTRNYSAVTAACLLTRREVFLEVGGFDEEHLPVIFNDVDLCLKMRRAGYQIVYTPFAKLYHDESATRRASVEPSEAKVLLERWPDLVARDPFYNPNLSRDHADFSLGT
ncbi:MAG TPA: glycosyltransferase [Chthoniobacterales bacterium]